MLITLSGEVRNWAMQRRSVHGMRVLFDIFVLWSYAITMWPCSSSSPGGENSQAHSTTTSTKCRQVLCGEGLQYRFQQL